MLADALEDSRESPALSLFRREWHTYRKVVENNYMFHREVYAELHRLLRDEAPQPFRFLDIACGDASASATALKGTTVALYYGIDLSRPALDLASKALAALGCPVTIEQRDLVEAVLTWNQSIDVAWIGQSLHHFDVADKLLLMSAVRRAVGERGFFLIWEPARLDDENRNGWLSRFERTSRPLWAALTPEEWDAMLAHIRAADFPETDSRWRALGREAGFGKVRELFVAPTNINRMYCFQA